MFLSSIPLTFLVNHYLLSSFILLIFFAELPLILFGILASRHESINLLFLLCSFSLSAIISEQTIFLSSRFTKRIGHFFFNKYENNWFYSFIMKRSNTFAIFLFLISRFFPILRIAAPLAMGAMNMPVTTFTIVNIIVSITWCTIYVFLGYGIGSKTAHMTWSDLMVSVLANYQKYKKIATIAVIGTLSVLLLISLFIYIMQKQRKGKDEE